MLSRVLPCSTLGAELGRSSWHADWKEETRACCGGFRGETEDGSSRGGRTFPREPESHILRDRRLLTPKESRGPSSFVSVTFQWQRGASLGEVPARLCGTAGPRGDSEGTNQQRLCGGWRRATFRNRCRISGCPSPHRRPARGFLFPGLWRPGQPRGRGAEFSRDPSAPDFGWAAGRGGRGGNCPRTARAQGCKPLRRAGLSACKTRVKLSLPLQASRLTRRPRADGRGRSSNARRSGPQSPRGSCGLKAAALPPSGAPLLGWKAGLRLRTPPPATPTPIPRSREAVYCGGSRPGFFHPTRVPRSRLGEEERPLAEAVPPSDC